MRVTILIILSLVLNLNVKSQNLKLNFAKTYGFSQVVYEDSDSEPQGNYVNVIFNKDILEIKESSRLIAKIKMSGNKRGTFPNFFYSGIDLVKNKPLFVKIQIGKSDSTEFVKSLSATEKKGTYRILLEQPIGSQYR